MAVLLAGCSQKTQTTEEVQIADTTPALIFLGREYFAKQLPVDELPTDYEYVGELTAEEANGTGLEGCKYFMNTKMDSLNDLYVYQECALPVIGDEGEIVDNIQHQWAYVKWEADIKPIQAASEKEKDSVAIRAKQAGAAVQNVSTIIDVDVNMPITEILDAESEFLISTIPDIRIVYAYVISEAYCEKHMFSVDYAQNDKILIPVGSKARAIYLLCPEYTVVEAVTRTDSAAAKEICTYLVDKEPSPGMVGGDPQYRIFEIAPSPAEEIRFTLCSSDKTNNSGVFGSFRLEVQK